MVLFLMESVFGTLREKNFFAFWEGGVSGSMTRKIKKNFLLKKIQNPEEMVRSGLGSQDHQEFQ